MAPEIRSSTAAADSLATAGSAAYLRTLDAHDSGTAEALSTPSMRSTTQIWLGSTASITGIKIGAVVYDAQQPPGEQYSVPTYFTYSSHWWKNDPSFGDGEHCWGVLASQGRRTLADQ